MFSEQAANLWVRCAIMSIPALSLLVVNSLFIATLASDEILGCGGFVKSEVPIDFSQIEVRFFNALTSLYP